MKKKQLPVKKNEKGFHLEFLTSAQKIAYAAYQQNDVLFLLGSAGVGKSHLAMAFAIEEILAKTKSKIVISRPAIEAGATLGLLPGSPELKCLPYNLPLFDCINRIIGDNNPTRERINRAMEIAPINYMRGRTFHDSVCILDEAQNATFMQLKLFLTRFGSNSKVIVTGDPMQSDLPGDVALVKVVKKLESVPGIGVIEFKPNSIVRHPLVAAILEKLEAK